ncbi:hypothetical protein H2Y56_22125 [Pectobacterium aroidearum]|uniref:Uncharacterized protein n=1 Tax=Pectobacterium aroidearum TaxID=1201031 RepID=A0ABR5ZJW9_9GAMM|nr:hypothetical protein [Pectobacterium aroidearum]MBA5234782.1 hypothetical protein [Pectobacterium aroidearum]MBA5739961.1 hypothetical protein [Pectobacterium aroidearum]
MNHQRDNLLNILMRKSAASIDSGSDGFISADSLRFDAGLSTQAIRRYLDSGVANGSVDHRQAAAGRRHEYRITGASSD